MNCMICGTSANYYFTKDFSSAKERIDRAFNLGNVEYFKCPYCGFVFSKTHVEADLQTWEDLNKNYHVLGEKTGYDQEHNPPPYLQQASMLKIALRNSLVSGDILDWGGGYGTLSRILKKYFDVTMKVFDRYVKTSENSDIEYIDNNEVSTKKFDIVVNSAVFEHVTRREHLEEINNCVSENGCLFLHTVIPENVPKDPDWFYLGAVHCAFHTNKSMSVLMEQWKYKSSIYSPLAKCWILLRTADNRIEETVKNINRELQYNYLYYKKGFMDYWK